MARRIWHVLFGHPAVNQTADLYPHPAWKGQEPELACRCVCGIWYVAAERYTEKQP